MWGVIGMPRRSLQILGHVAGETVDVIFTPHLIPMDRGILTTAYSRLRSPLDEDALMQMLHQAYHEEPFVRVVDHLPASKDTVGTNFCDITARLLATASSRSAAWTIWSKALRELPYRT